MILLTGVIFSLALVSVSYLINRSLLGGRLPVDGYQLALTASAVVFLALAAESLINPLYTAWFGEKLWVYRVLPLHDGNVSGLGVLVWAAYGMHLYFTRQMLSRKLPNWLNHRAGISLIIGFEAPFIYEVAGNLFFLQMLGNYYAYYLPADVFHLTSWRVVPVYIFCVYAGLAILDYLNSWPRLRTLPPALVGAGIAYLMAG